MLMRWRTAMTDFVNSDDYSMDLHRKRNYLALQDMAKQHALIASDIPFDTRDIYAKDEWVLSMSSAYATAFCRNIEHYNRKSAASPFPSSLYFVTTENRQTLEWAGHDRQIIAAAIIHTDDELMLLELNKRALVDHYCPGTLTMIQGHVKSATTHPSSTMMYGSDIIERCEAAITRELSEEIRLKADAPKELHDTWMNDLAYAPIMMDTNVRSVMYNQEGTLRKHICVYFDIPLDEYTIPSLYRAFKEHLIESNEPEKHFVRYLKYEDMLNLSSMDIFCDWVKGVLANASWFDAFCDPAVIAKYGWKK